MSQIAIGAQREAGHSLPVGAAQRSPGAPSSWRRRAVLALVLACGIGGLASDEALAVTLKLAFSDGQPMTYGSACSGEGCLQAQAGVKSVDANGEVVLADRPDGLVEYRRDGIELWQAPAGDASGLVRADGERATVVLARMLFGSAAAVDAGEWDVVSRINEQRRTRGLAPAKLSTQLSAAADLQANWLSGSALGLLPVLSHSGPFGTTTSFRLGEVSFPEPLFGAEIAAAGATPAEALAFWLASAPHREQMLASGGLLIGVGMVGSVIVVILHPPCTGCAQAPAPAGAMTGSSDTAAPPRARALQDGTAPMSGGATTPHATSCGSERLRVTRLRSRVRRMRARVRVGCLRPGAVYKLTVMQRPSHRMLTVRTISRSGSITLALRPARTTRALRIKLKRNGRVVAARTISRRR